MATIDDMSFNFRPVKSILPIHSGQSLCVLSSILETKFSYPEKITIMMSDPVSVRSTRVSTPRITSDSVALKACSTKCASSCSALMRRTTSVKKTHVEGREQPAARKEEPFEQPFQHRKVSPPHGARRMRHRALR